MFSFLETLLKYGEYSDHLAALSTFWESLNFSQAPSEQNDELFPTDEGPEGGWKQHVMIL